MNRVLSRVIFCATKLGSILRIANHTKPSVAIAVTMAHNDTNPHLKALQQLSYVVGTAIDGDRIKR